MREGQFNLDGFDAVRWVSNLHGIRHNAIICIIYIFSISLSPSSISAADQATHQNRAINIVRDGRIRLKMTQVQFGRVVKLSQGEISRIETGAIDPPAWLIMYLLHLFPELGSENNPDVKQLRKVVHEGIDRMSEAALRIVLMLLAWDHKK